MNVWLALEFGDGVVNSGDQLNSASDKTEKFVSEPPSPCKLPIARSLSFSPEKVNTVDVPPD